MPYCRECGKPLEKDDKFCRYCAAPTGGGLSKPVEGAPIPMGESVILTTESAPPPSLEAPTTGPIEKPRLELTHVRGLVGRALRAIAWFVLCSILAIVLTFAIVYMVHLLGVEPPETLLMLFPVFLIPLLYKSRGMVFPARFEEDVSTTGTLVMRTGEATLEGTVRNVDVRDQIQAVHSRPLPGLLAYSGKKIIRFRLELSDPQGNLEYVPVEIQVNPLKWVGLVSEGDKVRVTGKFKPDGVLYAKRASNLTTRSLVGER